MPRYVRDLFSGELREEEFSGSCVLHRTDVADEAFAQLGELPQVSRAYDRPLESHSLAVHKKDVQKHNEFLKERGITGAYYRPSDGVLVQETRTARAQVHKARNAFDKDAGYSDWAG